MCPTPEVEDLLHPGSGDVDPRDANGTGRRASESGQDFHELRLPVPVYSGKAHDLAGVHGQRQPANRLDATVVACPDIVDLEHRGTRARSRFLDSEQHLAPHHEASEAGLGRSVTLDGLDLPSASEHGDSVRDLENLVQLVGDEDDRHALAVEGLQDREELRRFLRSEDSRGLVEDEDVGPSVERLQDLHTLLLSDRDVFDVRVGIDRESEALG